MDAAKLGEALWKTHLENMRALDQIVEASHIRGESGVLLYLYHTGVPMYPGELTDRLGLTTGRVANILKELERAALIVRSPDGQDRRRVLVSLTGKGEAIARARHDATIAYHARLMTGFSDEETRQFFRMIQRIVNTMENDAGNKPASGE